MMNGLGPVSGSAGLARTGTFSSQTLSLHILTNHKDIEESSYLWLPSRVHQQVETIQL